MRGHTVQERETPRTTHVAEEKNRNELDVEADTTAFKVKVLHPLTPGRLQ